MKLQQDTLSPTSLLIEYAKNTPILGWQEDQGFYNLKPCAESLLNIATETLKKKLPDNASTNSLPLQYLRDGTYWKKWQQN